MNGRRCHGGRGHQVSRQTVRQRRVAGIKPTRGHNFDSRLRNERRDWLASRAAKASATAKPVSQTDDPEGPIVVLRSAPKPSILDLAKGWHDARRGAESQARAVGCQKCGRPRWRDALRCLLHAEYKDVHRIVNRRERQPSLAEQVWPYGATDGELMDAINHLVPRGLPEQVREEVCQEMVLAVLEGRARADTLMEALPDALKAARAGYQFSTRFVVSLDVPAPGQVSDVPLHDLLAGPSFAEASMAEIMTHECSLYCAAS